MKPRSVAVELLSDHIDLVACAGSETTGVKRIPITLDSDPCEWAKAVRQSGGVLRSAVEEMNLRSLPTFVLYRSPTQAADLASFQLKSGAQAMEAGRLACTDSLPYSAMSAVSQAAVAGRDAAGDERQIHVVTAAERDDIASAIAQMVQEAGLQFVSATPIDALVFAITVSSAMSDGGELNGRLYVGEHSSVFLAVGQGKLFFARRIGLGLDSLAGSLTRPIRRDTDAEPIELKPETARDILHRCGLPDRETVIHEEYGLTGGDVIPLMQPVLQRFIVELRQSIRFGLPEGNRGELSITLTGPGGTIPGLAELIGQELEAEVETDADRPAYDWTQPGSRGSELGDALTNRPILRRLNLLPNDLAARRRISQVRRWLWTGTAAALLVIAFDAVRFHLRLDDARNRANALAVQCADIETLRATGEKLRGALTALNETDRLIAREVGTGVDFPACMQGLSEVTPETVRFTSVRFYLADQAMQGNLTGYAFSQAESGRTQIEELIAGLNASPLFGDVTLGAVQMGEMDDAPGQRFNVTFQAIGSPTVHVQGLMAAADERAKP